MRVGCGLSKRRVFTVEQNRHSKTIFNSATETVKANNYKVETHSREFFNSFKNSLRIINSLGLVAQSVEQRIENPCVGGSIPPRATKNLNSPLAGLFLLEAVDGVSTLILA